MLKQFIVGILLFFNTIIFAATPTITSTPVTTAVEDSLYEYRLKASDGDNDTLTWATKSGSPLPSWLSLKPGGISSTLFDKSITVSGIASDDTGNVYATTVSGNKVYKITPSGEKTEIATVDRSTKYGMLLVSNYLYIAYYNLNKITRIDLNDISAGESDFVTIESPSNMVEKDGSIYVAQNRARKVSKINIASKEITSHVEGKQFFGLDFDSKGNLLLVALDEPYIYQYDGTTLSRLSIPSIGVPGLSDIKVGENNNIYISGLNNVTKKITSDLSTITDIIANRGSWSITANSNGTLFLGNTQSVGINKLETATILSGTPTNDNVGVNNVKLTLTDGKAIIAHDFQITVANTNDAPTSTNSTITIGMDISVTF